MSAHQQDISELEKALGYVFKGKDLLLEALTHKSLHHENPGAAPLHNERLEFLGDSVFGLIIAMYLFNSGEHLSESMMSKLKSYIVKESVLYETAGSISLGTYLRVGKGEEETGGRHKRSIVADALEAVIGAVYLDGGAGAAERVVLGLFSKRLKEAVESGEFYDHKSGLQEKTQMEFGLLPEYRVVAEEGAEHKKIFTIEVHVAGKCMGRGKGKTKKEAETRAAKEALRSLRQAPLK